MYLLFIIVVQLLSHVWLSVTPWTAALQTSLSFTISWSLLKLMSIESLMPSNHIILCHPLLLLPSVLPSIRVFSSELAFCIRWPKYWSFITQKESRTNCETEARTWGRYHVGHKKEKGKSIFSPNCLDTWDLFSFGDGNPLQSSCLENPTDGGAW